MLSPTYRCTRCGCEAAATNAALVEAMGWLVAPAGNDEASFACLCAACRRLSRAALARSAGGALDAAIS